MINEIKRGSVLGVTTLTIIVFHLRACAQWVISSALKETIVAVTVLIAVKLEAAVEV